MRLVADPTGGDGGDRSPQRVKKVSQIGQKWEFI